MYARQLSAHNDVIVPFDWENDNAIPATAEAQLGRRGAEAMRTKLGWIIALLLIASPAFAQKIAIDYAEDYDFNKVETFAYVETEDTNSADPLMHERIKVAIVNELTAGGLTQVDSDADLYVTYHLTSKDSTVLNTSSYGYGGYGRGWHRYGGGLASSTTTATTYTEGTLIVDAYEPGGKKMVWRGTGTVTLKAKPEKRTKQIDKIMTKMGAKWAKILAKQGT